MYSGRKFRLLRNEAGNPRRPGGRLWATEQADRAWRDLRDGSAPAGRGRGGRGSGVTAPGRPGRRHGGGGTGAAAPGRPARRTGGKRAGYGAAMTPPGDGRNGCPAGSDAGTGATRPPAGSFSGLPPICRPPPALSPVPRALARDGCHWKLDEGRCNVAGTARASAITGARPHPAPLSPGRWGWRCCSPDALTFVISTPTNMYRPGHQPVDLGQRRQLGGARAPAEGEAPQYSRASRTSSGFVLRLEAPTA